MTDIVVRNARAWSRGRVPPDADTAVIHDGVFAFVGRSQDANPSAGARTIDAAGRRMLPGFTDAHVHLMGTGAAMEAVDLKGVPTVEEAARRVAERASTVSPGTWIRGTGWDQHLWPDASFPDRRSLDAIAPAHPIVAILPLIGMSVSADPPPNPAAVRPAASPLLSGNHLTALATVAM